MALDVALALAGQGLHASARPGDRVLAAARQAVAQAANLVSGRFIQRTLPVVARNETDIVLPDGSLRGEAIARALDRAKAVVAVVCTIGPALDDRVSALLSSDPLLAMALEGLGSAACERLAGDVMMTIEQQAVAGGNRVTGPLAPGMIGWPLRDAQDELFALIDPMPIGVALTPSGQMIPRKTLSFLVGVGVDVPAHAGCPACGARDRCKFRPDHA